MENILKFKKYDGTFIEDVTTYVERWVAQHPHCTITVGCDSQEHARFIKYSVTICLHDVDQYGIGHGAHVVYADHVDNNRNMKSDIYTKLWAEAELTIQAAKLLEEPALKWGRKITIHLDYNSSEKEYSNVLYAAGLGFVKGMGFEAHGKPFAWASTHVADKLCRK